MFEFDWAQAGSRHRERCRPEPPRAPQPKERVARTSLLHWREHCTECAAPACYQSCGLYVARADGECLRFDYGIVPNRDFPGLLKNGADLRFRRWGKLESWLYGRSVSTRLHRALDSADRALCRATRAVASLETRATRRLFSRGLRSLRRRIFARALHPVPRHSYDDFVVECYSPDPENFRLILEVASLGQTLFREALPIEPGWNSHRLPVSEMDAGADWSAGKISLYPENDAQRRLIFTWLDFVQYADPRAGASSPGTRPSTRVKCVAWDLDNTLWHGILAESAPEELELNPDAAKLVRALDERGIIQTIVSKNHHDQAWARVEAFGLGDYFLYPAINWGQKSANLQQVAERLNIGIDTFALIDDSEFERAEVNTSLPQVRVYPHTDIPNLLERTEFDAPVTDMSRQRRQSYRANMDRERVHASFAGDYEDFLRSCHMKLGLSVPTTPGDVERCLELIQRCNQLNLSGRRYNAQEFEDLRKSQGVLCVAMSCEDRFGNYGIVGFASVDERSQPPTVRDFVLSCRVAGKRVEHTFFDWLAQRELRRGEKRLHADIIRTERNVVLLRVFEEMPFECIDEQGDRRLLELGLERSVVETSVMELESRVGD